MSLTNTLLKSIDDVINEYISRVSTEYSIEHKSLRDLWDSKDQTKKQSSNQEKKLTPKSEDKKEQVDTSDLPSGEDLVKCNKNELVALCKIHGHKWTGTKNVLLSRLLGKDIDDLPSKSVSKKADKKTKESTVVKKIVSKIPSVTISRNQFDNYEHPDSGLVFNKKQTVIGKQNDDGSIDTLTEEDIDTCKKYKFKFDIPENLDQKVDLEDIAVDELDDDMDEDIDDDELPVEVELIEDGDGNDDDEYEYEDDNDDDYEEEYYTDGE